MSEFEPAPPPPPDSKPPPVSVDERSSLRADPQNLKRGDGWVLIERWCERYPDDWRLYFERPDGMSLEVSVPEDVWRAFDGIKT